MRILEDMNKCYGCHACYNACPANAIRMTENTEGFLMPSVNSAMCVKCDMCRKVCPQINASYPNAELPEAAALIASDEIRAESSSGGAFSVIAEYILKNKGFVCGAAFDRNFEAHHIIIDNIKDLGLIRKSKYIQSRIGSVYSEIKELLSDNKTVFFTGTPCQVAGLYSFLGKKYPNLITADLLCHGTPSPKAWKIYLDSLPNRSEINSIEFRSKKNGWTGDYNLKISYNDKSEIIVPHKENRFIQAFINSKINRKSCASCQFARCPRQGDFTIGDFWGVNKYEPSLNDKKGTSVVLINNSKASDLLDKIHSQNNFVLQEISLLSATESNPALYRFPQYPPDRISYMNELIKSNSFEKADTAKNAFIRTDIGIISWFYATNYGAVLTSYALTKAIEDIGYSCTLVDIPKQFWAKSKHLRNPLTFSKRFIYKYCNVTSQFDLENKNDMQRLNRRCKAFAVASDQLWRWDKIKNVPEFFFLGFADKSKNKFSYSTSFGGNTFACENKDDLEKVKNMLSEFSGISVREKNGVDICKNTFGMNAVQVLDPVFLCNRKHYDNIATNSKVKGKKFIVAYMLAYSKGKEDILRKIADILQREIILIPDATKGRNAEWEMPMTTDISVEDFVYYVKNSDLIVTDSFHAVCFSLIYGIPFVATSEKRAGKDRFTSLLNMVGMSDRLFPEFKSVLEKPEMLTDHPDFSKAHKILEREKVKSMNWLINTMEK